MKFYEELEILLEHKFSEVTYGCVVIDSNRILCIKTGKNKYELPKGHKDPGESNKKAAARETAEETGIKVEIVGEKIGYFPKNNSSKATVFYIAKEKSKNQKPHLTSHAENEIMGVEWLKINDILQGKVGFKNYQIPVIKKVKKWITG